MRLKGPICTCFIACLFCFVVFWRAQVYKYFRPLPTTIMMAAYARAGHRDTALFESLLGGIEPQLVQVLPVNVAGLLWAASKLDYLPAPQVRAWLAGWLAVLLFACTTCWWVGCSVAVWVGG